MVCGKDGHSHCLYYTQIDSNKGIGRQQTNSFNTALGTTNNLSEKILGMALGKQE